MPEETVSCDLCHRSWSSKIPFHCTSCAQAQLYGPRIQHTLLQLETEEFGRQIEEATDLSKSKSDAQIPDLSPEKAAFVVERAEAQRALSEDRIQLISKHTESLRDETQSLRVELDAWQSRLSKRRADLETAKRVFAEQQKAKLVPVQKSIEKINVQWKSLYTNTVQARVFLCREAALLYGLMQRKRKNRSEGRDVYYIGGLPIFDLRDLNNASPAHLTASTAHLAHLLHLLSHYLAVRLPAEITLPHREYPHATIFSPASSYQGREVPFPGSQNTSAAQSSHNSPTASKHSPPSDYRHGPLPKPRPLHLTKKLGVLAKDNPMAYGALVDGIALLAWDVAWLCKSQGLDVSDPKGNHWEEVCAMGKNLWTLLFDSSGDGYTITSTTTNKQSSTGPGLGQLSHGTLHSFLGTGDAVELMRTWRLKDPVKVIERVRAMLVAERTGADWEVVMDEEVGNDVEDTVERGGEQRGGVVIQGSGKEDVRRLREGGIEEDAVMVGGEVAKRRESARSEPIPEEKAKGPSGWMKIRGRSGG